MKKYLLFASMCITSGMFAQQLSKNLNIASYNYAVSDNLVKPVFEPELSYYSKNYDAVFGRKFYTFNNTSFSNIKNIYVADSETYYYTASGALIPHIPFAGDTVWPDEYGKATFIGGVLSMILGENLTDLEESLSTEITNIFK